jgi:uncharacterized protein YgiM (DUF1202 family)
MNIKTACLACVIAAVMATPAARAEDVWINTDNVALRTAQSPAAESVANLFKGAKAQQLQKQGNWVQIQVNGKTGWVSAASVSLRPQKPNSGLLGGNSSVEMSSAAAAKGLEPMSMQFGQNQHLSEAGINQMVQIKRSVTPQMLQDFMTQGHVGAPAPAPAPAPAR